MSAPSPALREALSPGNAQHLRREQLSSAGGLRLTGLIWTHILTLPRTWGSWGQAPDSLGLSLLTCNLGMKWALPPKAAAVRVR